MLQGISFALKIAPDAQLLSSEVAMPLAEAPWWLLELIQRVSGNGNGVGLPTSEPVPLAEALRLMSNHFYRVEAPH